MKAKFYINIIHQIWKKRTWWSLKGDRREETVFEFEGPIPDPIFHMYMSWILWTMRQVKILNWQTNFDNILGQHLIKIKTTNRQNPVWWCWLFIDQLKKSSMKVPRKPSIQFSVTNKKVPFYISSVMGPQYLRNTRLSITSIMFT